MGRRRPTVDHAVQPWTKPAHAPKLRRKSAFSCRRLHTPRGRPAGCDIRRAREIGSRASGRLKGTRWRPVGRASVSTRWRRVSSGGASPFSRSARRRLSPSGSLAPGDGGTWASKARQLVGPSSTKGAIMPLRVSPATKVVVFQWLCGWSMRRRLRKARKRMLNRQCWREVRPWSKTTHATGKIEARPPPRSPSAASVCDPRLHRRRPSG